MHYQVVVGVYEQLESTSKRLEKTKYLAEFLRTIPPEELELVMLLVQGKVFPNWDPRELGMAARLVLKAINIASGVPMSTVEHEWKQTGDLGTVAEKLVTNKKQETLFSQTLTVQKVFANLRKLSELEGQGTMDHKVKLVAELLTSAQPKEAKYVIRTVLSELRVGLGEGTVRDAIVWACFADEIGLSYDAQTNTLVLPENSREKYNKYVDAVQEACDIANDYAAVAKIAKTSGLAGLASVNLEPGKPIKVMLYQKAKNLAEAFKTCGRPSAIEVKYDGFRMQIHKSKEKIWIFTRRLENVTAQFPDVVAYVREYVKGDSFILDAEAVGCDASTQQYLPFQNISQRIKRKYNIEEMARKFPVEVNVFDVMFYGGRTLLKTPYKERRALLESAITNELWKFKAAEQLITMMTNQAQLFYQDSLKAGHEGIMMKNMHSVYKPGSRVGYGVKVKPVMETLDVVIIGAEWGEGKRAHWLSSFMIAVYDPDKGVFVAIGKMGTGIKEKAEEGVSFGEMTELLKPLILKEDGREVSVKPEIVIEVQYEEIQKSPTYNSGYALRFPRFVKLRTDRSPETISTIAELQELYGKQRGRIQAASE